MSTRATNYLALIGVAALVAASFALGRCSGDEAVVYRDVVVDSAAAVQGEPTPAEPSLGEKVASRDVEPEVTATAPGAALQDVRDFCAGAGTDLTGNPAQQAPATDTAARVAAPPLPTPPAPAQARALIRSGYLKGSTFRLWEVVNTGDLRVQDFRGVHEPFEFRASGDSVLVRSSRWWWADETAGLGTCLAGGVAGVEFADELELGALLFPLVGCGLGALFVF